MIKLTNHNTKRCTCGYTMRRMTVKSWFKVKDIYFCDQCKSKEDGCTLCVCCSNPTEEDICKQQMEIHLKYGRKR